MKVKESSAYVKARCKLLSFYFSKRGWVVSDGTNNNILFYVSSDQPFLYTTEQLANIIAQSDFYIEPTGLKMSGVSYLFYHQGKLVNEVIVLPCIEFDTEL